MAAITGVRSSDPHAAALYERHGPRVFGYCLSRLDGREDAEDATQLTFLHAVRGLRRGIVPAAESAWLLAIARNVCLSRWASASRRRRLETSCDPLELERLATTREPRTDDLIGLEHALELLPEQQRRAVLLRDWRGLPYDEIAERLGVSHAAVESLIFRGRAALAEHLAEQPASRRRLRPLSELGAFLHSIKSALTGAAGGAKLAVTVAGVVAVSGSGIALGTSLTRPTGESQPVPTATANESSSQPAAPARASSGPPAASSAADRMSPPGTSAADPRSPAVPAAPAPAPAAEREPTGNAAAQAPKLPLTPTAVESPSLSAALPDTSLELPALEAPALPSAELPSTDAVIAATDPITAAAGETLAAATAAALPATTLPPLAAPEQPATESLLP